MSWTRNKTLMARAGWLGDIRRTPRRGGAFVGIFLFQKVEQFPHDSPAPLARRERVIGYFGQQFVSDTPNPGKAFGGFVAVRQTPHFDGKTTSKASKVHYEAPSTISRE